MSNVLLNLGSEPRFDQINPADIKPALHTAMKEVREGIADIKAQTEITWLNTVERMTDLYERVNRIWGVVWHLNSVVDTPELRAVYNELTAEVTAFFSEIGQDIELYRRYKALKNSAEFEQLDDARRQKLNYDLRGFVLSGAELPEKEQEAFAKLQTENAQLSAQFAQNVMDSNDSFALYFDDAAALDGVPEYALQMFASAAQAENKSGYKVTLQMPHYQAVMLYAHDRALREKLYRAYITRASELCSNPEKWDNTPVIGRIVQIALEEAKLLGFKNYAELSLATKMADSPEQVLGFLEDLRDRARPSAEKDVAQVRRFAAENLGFTDDITAWDWGYVTEKLREAKYSFSEAEVKKYFPTAKVMDGLFALIGRLYGVGFKAKDVPVWHPDVRYFELEKQGETIGGVYLDLYAREGKSDGAWMDGYIGRRRFRQGERAGSLQLPIAYLVCNFTPPVNGKEAYLSHYEVLTLFHEMGHGLHHLLTEVEELSVAGISGVEWDAVELPSQFMENFAWEYEVVRGMTAHEDSGEPLPESLFEKMNAAKNFLSGCAMLRQMEFALSDMLIYTAETPEQMAKWRETAEQVRRDVSVMPWIDFNRFVNSFNHIFAGGYSAGYYSYAWAEVLSADVYAAFEESGDPAATGAHFLREILSRGGSRSAMESFKAFRGREPKIDALLRHRGLD